MQIRANYVLNTCAISQIFQYAELVQRTTIIGTYYFPNSRVYGYRRHHLSILSITKCFLNRTGNDQHHYSATSA